MKKYMMLSELFKITKNLNKSMEKLNIDTEFYLKIAENEDYLQKCCLFDKIINKNEIDDKFPKNEAEKLKTNTWILEDDGYYHNKFYTNEYDATDRIITIYHDYKVKIDCNIL